MKLHPTVKQLNTAITVIDDLDIENILELVPADDPSDATFTITNTLNKARAEFNLSHKGLSVTTFTIEDGYTDSFDCDEGAVKMANAVFSELINPTVY